MNIGLVLSGGMAKGAFQIGALRALSHYVPLEEIKYMSCSSVGVLNGYAYATECLDQAEAMWKNLCNSDTRMLIGQILRSSMLQQNITEIYNSERKLPFTFYCALLDMGCRNIVYKDLHTVDAQKIPLYLKASVAMPVYNRAVKVDQASYFDGAMIDNIPIHPLLKHHLDYVICVYFDDVCYKFENTYFDNKIIKITFPAQSMLKQSVVFDKEGIDHMIHLGYDRTMQLLRPIFSKGYEDIDHIYASIERLNRRTQNKRLRITGDVLVTNLNKITQRLTKRKIL